MTPLIVFIVIIVILVLFFVSSYNRLVSLRNNKQNAFADIDVQLKQRHDLIPQLVESVKGYMKHESGVLTSITEARSNAINANSLDKRIQAENQLTTALQGLKVAVEAYPDLKANQNFMQLQGEISDIENKLAASRRYFNSATKEYNTATEVFPSNIIAGMFNFQKGSMFEVNADERTAMEEAPKINFD
jgi:LemA protein